MFTKAVFPGQYLQGVGVVSKLPELILPFGKRGLLLASPTVMRKIAAPLLGNKNNHLFHPIVFSGECCEEEIARLTDIIVANRLEFVVGMGGGKTIDTAKIAADQTGLPVVVVPTIASTDAPCSGCAVVYSRGGEFSKVLYQRRNPAAVLVDLQIIAQAPDRLFVAGMGDALATWFEARSCQRTQSMNECGGLSTAAGFELARLCYNILHEDGLSALLACRQNLITQALARVTEANILLSGIGFESGGLAAAHAIHNGLTALEETHSFYHGEKVAFGTLSGLILTAAPQNEIQEVISFCLSVGLPVTLAQLGLDYNNRERLYEAALKSCEPTQSIHHEAGEINATMVLDAMLMADALGRKVKNNASS